jgi:hypothetical protein
MRLGSPRFQDLIPLVERRLPTIAVLICAVFVQTGFLLLLPTSIRGNDSADYADYYRPVAQNILSGRGMVDTSGSFGTMYPPGFPVYLAGIFYMADLVGLDRMTSVAFFNLLLMSMACIVLFWTVQNTFNTRIALICAGLWLTYPFNLYLLKQPNSEVPFVPLLYGSTYCVIRAVQRRSMKFVIVSGLLLSASALIRPIAFLLIIVVVGFILLNRTICRKKRFVYAALLVGVYCLGLLPWEATVYFQTRRVIPLSTNGPPSVMDGLTFIRRVGSGGVPEPVAELMQRVYEHHRDLLTTGQIARYLMATELKQNPRALLELVGLKLARSWYGTDSRAHERPIQFIQLFYLLLGSAGIYLSIRQFPRERYYIGFFIALVLYFWGMAVVGLSILRYLVPVMAYLLIPCAIAIDTFVAHRQRLYTSHALRNFRSSST